VHRAETIEHPESFRGSTFLPEKAYRLLIFEEFLSLF
jgi:hypothetical protein